MQLLRWGLVKIANRDIASLGFTLSGGEGVFGDVGVTQTRTPTLGAAGPVVSDPAVRFEAKTITLRVAYLGTDPQGALDQLNEWMLLGPATFWHRARPTQETVVSWGGATLVPPDRLFGRGQLVGTIRLVRETPYFADILPQRRVSTVTGQFVPVETGTANAHVMITVVGPTSPLTITHRAWDGSVVTTTTVTFSGSPTVQLDTRSRQVVRYSGAFSTATPDANAIAYTTPWPSIEARYANRAASQWQTLAASSGQLMVDSTREWVA